MAGSTGGRVNVRSVRGGRAWDEPLPAGPVFVGLCCTQETTPGAVLAQTDAKTPTGM